MNSQRPFLPFALPEVGEAEIEEVAKCLRSGWLTTGPKARQFEKEFADYLGVKHAVAVNSATAGLHLALEAIGIGPGDKVITSTLTFTATAEVVRYLGADPVLVDIDPQSFNIDTRLVADALASSTAVKAIMPVHYGGQSVDMDEITALAGQYGVKVIEDAAHALPTRYKGKLIGGISDATVFSFYATKTLATGEGGMLVTENDAIAERAKVMRLHGISRDVFDRHRATDKPAWYYEVIAPGFKYNLTDIAAAIGIQQLRRVDAMRGRRQEIADYYNRELAGLPVRLPVKIRDNDLHSWHLYAIQLELEALSIDRNRFIELMHGHGIGTSVHYVPLHMHPYWRDRYALRPEQFPRATEFYRRCVSLPIYSAMTDADADRVVAAVRSVLKQAAHVA